MARFREDSIKEFRNAASFRFAEGLHLSTAGHRSAAIYLWGYSVEMILKAGWFSYQGFQNDQAIQRSDLLKAQTIAQNLGIPWRKGDLHNIVNWAELLKQDRMTSGRGYTDPAFGLSLIQHSQTVFSLWREWIRYKANRAYPYEVKAVASSANWFLSNSTQL
ncbi:MAG: hypothetical protein JXB10_09275 [Pirellulales bacterium]|nr:hypothetical protein [Pirellulales bacterium]